MKAVTACWLIILAASGVAAPMKKGGTKAPCPKTLCTAEYSHLACLIVDASLCDCHCVNTADPCHIFRDIQCDGGQMVNCTITGNVCNCMCDTEASK